MKINFHLFITVLASGASYRDRFAHAVHPKVIVSDDPVHDSFIVVLKNTDPEAPPPDTASSRMSTRKKEIDALTAFTNVKVTTIYEKALRGFAAKMTLAEAEAMAESDNIAYIEQDAKIRLITIDDGDEEEEVLSTTMISISDEEKVEEIVNASSIYAGDYTYYALTGTIEAENNNRAVRVPWGLDRIDQRELPLSSSYIPPSNGKGVTVYVMDTGIRITHREFHNNRASWGINTSGDGIDDDCDGHGTHVAGTIAGRRYGVAMNANVVAVKVIDCVGEGSLSSIVNGIEWIMNNVNMPAVTNLSFGASLSTSFNDAVKSLHNAGIPTVTSAGNKDDDACNYSPASVPEVITVGATNPTSTDDRYDKSNWGGCVTIMAPGGGIKSAGHVTDTATETLSGTSMAAAHVSGAVALLLEMGGVSPADIQSELISMATSDAVGGLPSGTPNKLLYVLQCVQSTAFFEYEGTTKRTCKWVNSRRKKLCRRDEIRRYCPSSCGVCDEWKCADAADDNLPFYTRKMNQFSWTCQKLQSLKEKRRKKLCENDKFSSTCRVTCGVCDDATLTLNFDDGNVTKWHYHKWYRHPNILMQNFAYIDGSKDKRQCHEAATISPPMIATNSLGLPMTISCPGGSFNLKSLYMTPAWCQDDLTVALEGFTNGSSKATFNVTLASHKQAEYFDSELLDSFTGLDALVFTVNKIGHPHPTAIAVDDIKIQIGSPCVIARNLTLDFDDALSNFRIYQHPIIEFMSGYILNASQVSGYEHLAISPPMVGYNSGVPLSMNCPGGSFDLLSFYVIPFQYNDFTVTLEGYKKESLKATLAFKLASLEEHEYFDSEQLKSFTDLDSLVLSTGPPIGTRWNRVIVDDIKVHIASPCLP